MDSRQVDKIISRSGQLKILLILAGLLFGARLFYLQVVKYDHYKAQALATHESKFSIPAERGMIYALDGATPVPLVLNENLPTLYADPSGIEDIDATAAKLNEITNIKQQNLRDLLSTPDSRYVVLAKKISSEKADEIEEAELPGIGLSDRPYRVYPQEELASQLLGFVNNEGVGQYGVEEALNERLTGIDGRMEAITDVHGIPLASNEDNVVQEPVDGDDLTLTIDINIQRFAEEALVRGVKRSESKSGSVIVMDPNTGAVKAMANYPTYNPEDFTEVDDYAVFQNDVVSAAYETGSGMKAFTMSAGINENAVNKNTTYYDSGSKRVGDRTITNADGSGGVTRTMLEVIQKSVNTGVIEVLERLGGGEINKQAREKLYEYFSNRFGFGSATGIEQPNEASGVIAGPNEGGGIDVRYANMTFGQGMTVTLLQMASALGSVVNGGDYYQPHLLYSTTPDGGEAVRKDPKLLRRNVIDESTSKTLKQMMLAVVNDGGGYSAKRSGYAIGGKTGTAQVLDTETGEYSDTREIGSFMGFGGTTIDNPQYVIMTRVDEPQIPGYAGTVGAAPIFSEISNWLIDYYQIPPRS